jgi:hypothetical protein
VSVQIQALDSAAACLGMVFPAPDPEIVDHYEGLSLCQHHLPALFVT